MSERTRALSGESARRARLPAGERQRHVKALDRHKLWIMGRRGSVALQGAVERARGLHAESKLHLDAGVSAQIDHVYRVAGIARPSVFLAPFRAPHHSVGADKLTGKLRGHMWRPGELALAHGGVLYLDDATEFSLDALREVQSAWRNGYVRLLGRTDRGVIGDQAQNDLTVPTMFSLVVGTLPCPCGNRGLGASPCPCTDREIARFHDRVRPLVEGAEVVRL